MDAVIICLPLLIGWILDLTLGDPARLPHPIVWFGKAISFCEHKFNRGHHRKLKGGLCSVVLILATYIVTWLILYAITNVFLNIIAQSIIIFYCLSGTTLIREVRQVFIALDKGIEYGRRQVARIVGRDTSALTGHEVQTAALETLSENLSDGVIAPLFWYALLGVPGMLAYKMVNTLDSMIGYRTERYAAFGFIAAKIDDAANYLPARITSILMVLSVSRPKLISAVKKYGRMHLSPNSGYPEAALAAILDCRFGGTHDYFGQSVYKPYIGENQRTLSTKDMKIAVGINRRVEIMGIICALSVKLLVHFIL